MSPPNKRNRLALRRLFVLCLLSALGLFACPVAPLPRVGFPCLSNDDCPSSLRCLRPCPPQNGRCQLPGAEPLACDAGAATEALPEQPTKEAGPTEVAKEAFCLKAEEVCDGKDNDCDGLVDEDLSEDCYAGPNGTKGVGLCKGGRKTCQKGVWSECLGEITPAIEDRCNAGTDDNCDGSVQDPKTCSWAIDIRSGTKGVGTAIHALVDPQGNTYIAGTFSSKIDIAGKNWLANQVNPSLFVVRFAPNGTRTWVKTINIESTCTLRALQGKRFQPEAMSFGPKGQLHIAGVFGGNIAINGKAYASKSLLDLFVWKLDAATGKSLWFTHGESTIRIPGLIPDLTSIAVDSKGRVFVLGKFMTALSWSGTTTKGVGNWDLFLAQFAPDGTLQDVDVIGGTGAEGLVNHGLGFDNNDTLYIAGTSSPPKNEPYKWKLGQHEISLEGTQAFVAARASDGRYLWVHTSQGTERPAPSYLAVSPQGKVALTGALKGSSKLFGQQTLTIPGDLSLGWVVQWDAAGKLLWQQKLDGKGANLPHSATFEKDALVLTGKFAQTLSLGPKSLQAQGKEDGFLLTFDSTGAAKELIGFSSSDRANGHSVHFDKKGQRFVFGTFFGTLLLDGTILKGLSSSQSLFLWKMRAPSP